MFESPCKKGVADAFFLCGAGGWVRQRSRAGASRAIVEAFDASRQRGPRVDYRELEGRSRFEMNARPMPKLPNSFLSRLRAQTPATLDAVSAPHPDADTLAAFAERALPASGRNSVAVHLAACADCRAALELAFGIEALPAPDARPAAAPGWWHAARVWRFLVPALAAGVALVFLVPQIHRTEPVRIAAVRPLPNPKFAFGSEIAVPASPAPAASAPELARSRAFSAPAAHSAGLAEKTSIMAAEEVPPVAAAPPPPRVLLDSLPQSVRVVTAAESRAHFQQAAPTAVSSVQSDLPQANAEVVAGQSQAPRATDYVAPSGRATQSQLVQQRVAALQSESAPVARSQRSAAPVPQPPARWEICRLFGDRQQVQGQLCQVSSDGARRAIAVDPSFELLAVASRGAEVWAGGAAGALFFSHDNGLHWRRSIVPATSQEQHPTLAEPIVAIDLSLPGQVRITTSTGENWILQDGLWRREAH